MITPVQGAGGLATLRRGDLQAVPVTSAAVFEITRDNGVTTSRASCDLCGNGWKWDGITSFTRMEYILRRKGWRIGKKHICEECREKGGDSGAGTG